MTANFRRSLRTITFIVFSASALVLPLLLSGCYLFGSDDNSPQSNASVEPGTVEEGDLGRTALAEDEEVNPDAGTKADALVFSAKTEYDKGQYAYAHEYALRVIRDYTPNDLEALLVKAWSNLQLGRIDDFEIPNSTVTISGAKSDFERVLEVSPNEFKAFQGLATLEFYRFRERQRDASLFNSLHELIGEQLAVLDDVRSFDPAGRDFADGKHKLLTDWREIMQKMRRLKGTKPELIEESLNPQDPEDKWQSWVKEDLYYDEARVHIRDGRLLEAALVLQVAQHWAKRRGEHWERESFQHASEADARYKRLKQRAPDYYYIELDQFRLHNELAQVFLTKGLDLARSSIRTQQWWGNVPDFKRDDVLSSYFADPESHSNGYRDLTKLEYARAIEHLEAFLRADEQSILRKDSELERLEQEYFSAPNASPVTTDYKEIFFETSRGIIKDQVERRLRYLRLLIAIYTYDWSLNQDLLQALVYIDELEAADNRDPMPNFIRGIVYMKKKEWKDAITEFNRFDAKSSIAMHKNRREFAGKLKHEAQTELFKENARKNRESNAIGG